MIGFIYFHKYIKIKGRQKIFDFATDNFILKNNL